MTISNDPFSEEVANISNQGKSPETLAKTKDGSTFAAKARAAELNATRARKAVAKHAHLLTDDVDYVHNDVPPLAPVPLGSFKFTSSRSRASNARKPPNNLTELQEVTAENNVKSPSPQHRSLQLLQRPSLSHQNLNQSISCLDPHPIPVIEYPGGDKASVSTEKPSVADLQTKVILKSSPHHQHKPLKHALDHSQPIFQRPTQDLNPSVSTEKPSAADWQTEVILKTPPQHHHRPLNHALGYTKHTLQHPTEALNPSHEPTPPSTHIDGTSASVERQSAADKQTIADWPLEPTFTPIRRPSLQQASPTISKYPGGSKASVSTEKPPVADWQTEVILRSLPHHQHKPLNHAFRYTQPSLQRATQNIAPCHVPSVLSTHIDERSASADRRSVPDWPFKPTIAPIPRRTHLLTPPSTHIDRTSASADNQSIVDWPVEPNIAPIPPPSLRQASPAVSNFQPTDSTPPSTRIDGTSASADRQSVPDWSFEPTIAPIPCRIHVPTPTSTQIDGASASADRKIVADWPFEPNIAPIPRPSLRQASPAINNFQSPGSPLRAHDPDHEAFNPNPANLWDPEMPPFYDMFGVPPNRYAAQDIRSHQYATLSSEFLELHSAISESNHPYLPPGSPMNPQAAQKILKKLEGLKFDEVITLSQKSKLRINDAQSALGQPLTDWDSFSTNRKGGDSTTKVTPIRTSTRDPNAYTNPMIMQKRINPDLPRTVAHDPMAIPPTTNPTSTITKSTLKPEAAIYTPRSAEAAAEDRLNTEAAGNKAMAMFVKQRKRQTLEEAVKSLRVNSMDQAFQTVKKQIEDHTDAMTASLRVGSLPDTEISRSSVAVRLPKPIGYGRPTTARTALTTAPASTPRYNHLDKRVGSDIIANTITNLMQHENPAHRDSSTRYRNAHACEVDQGPDGNRSLFDPEWGTPPSRVARDPRRMRQGGSGGVSGAFGRR